MSDEQPEQEQAPVYDDLWGFLEDGGFTFPHPIESKTYPYARSRPGGPVLRDQDGVPLGGKRYRVESPDAETGLRLTALADIARAAQQKREVKPEDVAKLNLDDDQEREFAVQVLGDTYAELMADGVAWTIIQRVVQYAYIYFSMGAETAEKAAREGLFRGGKAVIPATNRAQRRAMDRQPKSR